MNFYARCGEVRNPNIEIRNKSEMQNPKQIQMLFVDTVLVICISNFEFVSYFGIRVSDLRLRRVGHKIGQCRSFHDCHFEISLASHNINAYILAVANQAQVNSGRPDLQTGDFHLF